MKSAEIRRKFLDFFKKRGHTVVPSSSLISDDPSVLLTTAGMQQFKPYFTGAADPIKDFGSKNTTSIQKSFRTSDIDSVGDESHLTFFEMLGNFSFGGYFKEGAINFAHEFITKELGLKIDYVSVFAGDQEVPADTESEKIWRSIGISDVRKFGRKENFWGPTGNEGPCGPTSEIYIGDVEIWNLVFNEYYCRAEGSLEKLKTPGVDTGMGLERLATVAQGKSTIFETDLFARIVEQIPDSFDERAKRIIADHARGIVFLISDGLQPSNKDAGYILRRLLRRLIAHKLDFGEIFDVIINNYRDFYPELNRELVDRIYGEEQEKFERTLEKGLRELEKLETIDAKSAFDLYQSYGLPFEVIKDRGGKRVAKLERGDFDKEFAKHQEISKAGAGQFHGGLADHEPQTIRLHTAHHLLLAALQRVLGPQVKQRGSHITQRRLRLDFSHSDKLTDEQLEKVENLVNQKVNEGLEVIQKEMPREEAEKIGAEMEFGAKYPDVVSVYFIEDKAGSIFSKEFCGGPHVKNTSEIGRFKILKEEASGAGVRRIRATII